MGSSLICIEDLCSSFLQGDVKGRGLLSNMLEQVSQGGIISVSRLRWFEFGWPAACAGRHGRLAGQAMCGDYEAELIGAQAKEGVIEEGSPAWAAMSGADRTKRRRAAMELQSKLKSPNFFVSRTRLCVRNLPYSLDEKQLKELLVAAVRCAPASPPCSTAAKCLTIVVLLGELHIHVAGCFPGNYRLVYSSCCVCCKAHTGWNMPKPCQVGSARARIKQCRGSTAEHWIG